MRNCFEIFVNRNILLVLVASNWFFLETHLDKQNYLIKKELKINLEESTPLIKRWNISGIVKNGECLLMETKYVFNALSNRIQTDVDLTLVFVWGEISCYSYRQLIKCSISINSRKFVAITIHMHTKLAKSLREVSFWTTYVHQSSITYTQRYNLNWTKYFSCQYPCLQLHIVSSKITWVKWPLYVIKNPILFLAPIPEVVIRNPVSSKKPNIQNDSKGIAKHIYMSSLSLIILLNFISSRNILLRNYLKSHI